MTDVERRLTELEMRFAHQERLAEDLSSIVAEQARAIDLLMRHSRELARRVRDMSGGSSQDDRPPPHY